MAPHDSDMIDQHVIQYITPDNVIYCIKMISQSISKSNRFLNKAGTESERQRRAATAGNQGNITLFRAIWQLSSEKGSKEGEAKYMIYNIKRSSCVGRAPAASSAAETLFQIISKRMPFAPSFCRRPGAAGARSACKGAWSKGRPPRP